MVKNEFYFYKRLDGCEYLHNLEEKQIMHLLMKTRSIESITIKEI